MLPCFVKSFNKQIKLSKSSNIIRSASQSVALTFMRHTLFISCRCMYRKTRCLCEMPSAGALFTKKIRRLAYDSTKYRSIDRLWSCTIALKFDSRLDSVIVDRPVKCQSIWHPISRHQDFGRIFIAWLTHCGLVKPYGVGDHVQIWFSQLLVAWLYQAITWISVNLASVGSSGSLWNADKINPNPRTSVCNGLMT